MIACVRDECDLVAGSPESTYVPVTAHGFDRLKKRALRRYVSLQLCIYVYGYKLLQRSPFSDG